MKTLAVASEKIVKGLTRIIVLHSNPAIAWQDHPSQSPLVHLATRAHRPDGA
jgi:hypothetical protein